MTRAHSLIGRVLRTAILNVLIPLICLGFWVSPAAAANNPAVAVKTGIDQVIQLLAENPGNPESLRHQILAVVDNYFDFQATAKKVLGPEWRRQPPEKREQFTRDFSRLLFDTYIRRVEGFTDHTITYSLIQQGAGSAVVRAYITGAQNIAPTAVDYYLHVKNGKWKVYDVVFSGVGLVTNYREQFNSILARSSFDGLLQQLEQRNNAEG